MASDRECNRDRRSLGGSFSQENPSVMFAKTVSVPLMTSVPLITSGKAGVEVLVIGEAEETLMRCEYEFRSGDAIRRGTYPAMPTRPRTTALVLKCILIV